MDYRRTDLKRLFHVLVAGSALAASACDHMPAPVDSGSDPVDSGPVLADAGHLGVDAGHVVGGGTDAGPAIDSGAPDTDAGGVCAWPCSC